jgi:hypothetical protein
MPVVVHFGHSHLQGIPVQLYVITRILAWKARIHHEVLCIKNSFYGFQADLTGLHRAGVEDILIVLEAENEGSWTF